MINIENLNLAMAKEIYYKNLYKIESYIDDPLNMLLDSKENISDPSRRENKKRIVANLENFRFEYIRHIEDTILGCFHYDQISDNKIKMALEYINEIRNDIKGLSVENIMIFGEKKEINHSAFYFMLFYNLSKKGTSDILDLSFSLYKIYKKTQLDFSKKSMLELCDIWEACINEYTFFNGKFRVLDVQNRQNVEKFFEKDSVYTKKYGATDYQIKQIIAFIDTRKMIPLLEKLSYQTYVLSLVIGKMKLKYNFLREYYTAKLNRYNEIERQFVNSCSSKVPDFDILKKSFRIITFHIESNYNDLIDESIDNFGNEHVKYNQLFQHILKSYEILYSSFFKICNTAKNNELAEKYNLGSGVAKIYFNGRLVEKSFEEARDHFREKLYSMKLLLDR